MAPISDNVNAAKNKLDGMARNGFDINITTKAMQFPQNPTKNINIKMTTKMKDFNDGSSNKQAVEGTSCLLCCTVLFEESFVVVADSFKLFVLLSLVIVWSCPCPCSVRLNAHANVIITSKIELLDILKNTFEDFLFLFLK